MCQIFLLPCFFNKLALVRAFTFRKTLFTLRGAQGCMPLPVLGVIVAHEDALVERAHSLASVLVHKSLTMRPPMQQRA